MNFTFIHRQLLEDNQLIRKDALTVRQEMQHLRADFQQLQASERKLQNSLLQILPKAYAMKFSLLLNGLPLSDEESYLGPDSTTSVNGLSEPQKPSTSSSEGSLWRNSWKQENHHPRRSLLQSSGCSIVFKRLSFALY